MASNCDILRPTQPFKDVSGFELNNKLKPLDDALRCRICFDYFNNCMVTKCSHNYCSVCIRRYMMYKAQCPTCFQDASEPELRNNRLVDEVLRTYLKIKEICYKDAGQLESPEYNPPKRIHIIKELPKDKDVSAKTQETVFNEDEVSCPVCYKMVLEDKINIHLDSCLKNKETGYSVRKTIPKLVYHLLSDKQIKNQLKEHGLSTNGDRQRLIRRHKNFLILYNANCDSLFPKPVADLLLEIEKQELEERLNVFTKPIQVNKKSDIFDIEREHEQYAKKHQSHFNALVQDVQQRNFGNVVVKQEPSDEDITATGNFSKEKIIIPVETSSASVSNYKPTSEAPCQIRIENITRLRTYGKGSRKKVSNTSTTSINEPVFKINLETMSVVESNIELPPSSQVNAVNQPTANEEESQEQDFIVNIKQEPEEDESPATETCLRSESVLSDAISQINIENQSTTDEESQEMDCSKNIKRKPEEVEIPEIISCPKSDEKIQDLLENENFTLLDDTESGKMIPINKLRKKKNRKTGQGKQSNPKTK